MEVRVGEAIYLAALLALAARRTRPLYAKEALRDPKRQTLLPHAGRSNEKGRLREPAGGKCAFQPVHQGSVSVNCPQTHSGRNLPGSGFGLQWLIRN